MGVFFVQSIPPAAQPNRVVIRVLRGSLFIGNAPSLELLYSHLLLAL